MDDSPTPAPKCDGCGGDRLPLTEHGPRGYGSGPAATRAVHLCPVCMDSFVISRWLAGTPPSNLERDVLVGNHNILAAIAAATPPTLSVREQAEVLAAACTNEQLLILHDIWVDEMEKRRDRG